MFSKAKCYKCIWCVAKMHFCIKCIWCKNAFLQRNAQLNIFLWKMYATQKVKKHQTQHFSAFAVPLHFVGAEHFPLENVMLNILQSQMWCWTFYFVKCTRCVAKMHFGIKCIFASNAFDAKMHFCNASNAFLHSWTFSKGKCSAPTKCTHQMHFCKTKC